MDLPFEIRFEIFDANSIQLRVVSTNWPAVSTNWPVEANWQHTIDHLYMPIKKQATNPDRLPYDPKEGF